MTKLVGILNVTPDSFSDGGEWFESEQARERIEELFGEGADLVDIGAESTRPGATEVQIEEEWKRLEPTLTVAREADEPGRFSIDTRHAEVARRAVDSWSKELVINDITGLYDPAMVELVAEYGVRVVVGHLPKAAGGDIVKAHEMREVSLDKVIDEVHEQLEQLQSQGIQRAQIIADPGIGFGKHSDLNMTLVRFAEWCDYPVMIGYSRKLFLGDDRLKAGHNAAIGQVAVASGAAFLRVHDMAAHKQVLRDFHPA